MNRTLYMETTIPSYLAARPSHDVVTSAKQVRTRDWWDDVRPKFRLFSSDLVMDEARRGDKVLVSKRLTYLQHCTLLPGTPDVSELARQLVRTHLVPKSSAADAVHIAISAVHEMDYLLTWNISHIANRHTAPGIARLCDDLGFKCPIICTPEDLLED